MEKRSETRLLADFLEQYWTTEGFNLDTVWAKLDATIVTHRDVLGELRSETILGKNYLSTFKRLLLASPNLQTQWENCLKSNGLA